MFARERRAEALVLLDGDHQHDPKDIPRLVQPIIEGTADALDKPARYVTSAYGAQFAAVREIFHGLGLPIFVTIGNHDHRENDDRSAFEQAFPNSLNYHFAHKGWQFVTVDSTQGRAASKTNVQKDSITYLTDTLKTLDKKKPTALLTHFPLGASRDDAAPHHQQRLPPARQLLCQPLDLRERLRSTAKRGIRRGCSRPAGTSACGAGAIA